MTSRQESASACVAADLFRLAGAIQATSTFGAGHLPLAEIVKHSPKKGAGLRLRSTGAMLVGGAINAGSGRKGL